MKRPYRKPRRTAKRRRLGLELLEDRRVLSVFYEFNVVGKAGLELTNGPAISRVIPQASVDASGSVVFPAVLQGGTQALVVHSSLNERYKITDDLPSTERGFITPQFTNDNKVAAIETDAGSGIAIQIWDASPSSTIGPDNPRIVVDSSDPGPLGPLRLTHASISDEQEVAFVNSRVDDALFFTDTDPLPTFDHITTSTDNPLPMAAAGRRIVYRNGTGTTGDIVVEKERASGGYERTILASTNLAIGGEFISIGAAPGISDDGSVVAFVGDRGNGPGVFLAVDHGSGIQVPLIVVAGETGGPNRTSPGLGFNDAGDGVQLIDFDFVSRVGVARLGSGNVTTAVSDSYFRDRYVVTLIATPSSASVTNPQAPGKPLLFSDQPGIWALPVNVDRQIAAPEIVYHPQSPIPVVQLGDVIDGGSVLEVSIHDPVSALSDGPQTIPNYIRGDHAIAFYASTTDGDKIVVARREDSDGDGLLNHWELDGIDIDNDGAIDLALPALGSDPLHKDIFVELDWLPNEPATSGEREIRFEPANGVTAELVRIFETSPVLNPDGTTGITLHIDAGPDVDAAGDPFSQNWDSPMDLQGGELNVPPVQTEPIDIVYQDPQYRTDEPGLRSESLNDIKREHFGLNSLGARELAFHYVLFANFGYAAYSGASVHTASVASATNNTVTLTAPTIIDDNVGNAIKITGGTGEGQIRTIDAHTLTEVTVSRDWSVVPDATSTVAFLDGTSGTGEIDFYSAPDYHAFPGNDVVVSLRGFDVNPVAGQAYDLLTNKFNQYRTLAHELGHGLGLRHCGNTTDSSVCKSNPGVYQSLMSYAHQLVTASTVNGFSDRSDTTISDWDNLRLDFHSNFAFVGNTSILLPDTTGHSTLTVQDYIDQNGGPPDHTHPLASLDVEEGSKVSKNQGLTVSVTASDDAEIEAVYVSLDLDGDGTVEPDERVLAESKGSGLYEASLGEITGPSSDRLLSAKAVDTSGNFYIDSVTISVTHDFPSLVSAIAQLGPSLQKSLPEIPEAAKFPFVTTTLAKVVDLTDTFTRLANRLYDDSRIVASAVPSPSLSRDASFLVNVGGASVVDVTVARSATANNTSMAHLVGDVNDALAAAGLSDMVTASEEGASLAFTADNDGSVTSLSITTLRLVADRVPVAFGQPGSDLTIGLEVERGTETTSLTIEVPESESSDNVDANDFATDLNSALLAIGATDLTFLVGANGKITIAAIDPTITGLTPQEIVPGDWDKVGFSTPQIGLTITELDFPELGLAGLMDVSDLLFDSFESFGQVLREQLAAISDLALSALFDVNVVYDQPSDTVYFNIELHKEYVTGVDLDLVDAGVNLGPLGTIEMAAIADGTFSVAANLNFRVGVYLGGLGLDFLLDDATVLSSLNGGAGVRIAVGATAETAAPSDGQIGGDINFQVRLSHEDSADDSVHFVTLRQHPNPTRPGDPAIDDNFDVASLASDLNLVLEQAGLANYIEFVVYDRVNGDELNQHIAIRALDSMRAGISPLRDLELIGADSLGFAPQQESDYIDLLLTLGTPSSATDTDCADGGCTIGVVLAGARTVQDVIEKIESATGGAVNVTVGFDGTTLEINSDMSVTVEQGFNLTDFDGTSELGFTSLAGIDLGILSAPDVSGTVAGDELHGQTDLDRVFLVEDLTTPNFLFVARLEGNLDVSAALGKLQFVLTTPSSFVLESSASAQFRDPNGDDGKITLPEMLAAPTEIVEINLATLIPSASGSLQAFSEIEDPWYAEGAHPTTTPLFELTFAADATNGFTFSADADFQNLFSSFKDVCVTQILDMLADFADQLEDESKYPWINLELPIINQRLRDILGFVDVLQSTFTCLPEVGDEVLIAAVTGIESAISNLSMPLEDRDRLFRMKDLLLAVVSAPEDPALLDEYARRFPTRLISASAQMKRIIAQDVPAATAGLTELLEAVAVLDGLFCTWDTLELRMETILTGALRNLLGDGIQVEVDIGMVEDLDGSPATKDRTITAGVILSGDVSLDFTPEFPVSNEFGPIEFELAPELTLVAGFEVALGMGLTLNALATPLFVVAPPAGSSDLVQTRVQATVGFNGALDTGVSFGSLDLVGASGYITLSNAINERDLSANGQGVVMLAESVLNDDEQLMIVTVNGAHRPPTEFQVNGRALSFLQNIPLPTDTVSVSYQSATTPGSPLDLVADSNQRAGLEINFVPPTPITENTIGAVPLAGLTSSINADIHGMLTSNLDVEFLGSTVEDAVSLAVSFDELSLPQLTVDEEALLGLFTNIDFDLKSILTGLETLLTFLEEGLTDDVIANIPVVGGSLDMTGTFLGTLREEFVTPFREFLCDFEGTLEETAEEAKRKVFEFLGPGLNAAQDPNGVGIPRGARILGDRNGDGLIRLDDVEVKLDTEVFEIVITIGGRDTMTTEFDLGIDGFPLKAEAQGGVELEFDYHIDLGFGVDRNAGPFFLTNEVNFPSRPGSEIEIQLDAHLSVDNAGPEPIPTSLDINLFGLSLSATDILDRNDESGTSIVGALALDLQDIHGDGRVLISDLAKQPFGDLFAAELSADVDVNLRLAAGLGTNLPQVQTDLVAEWSAGLSTTRGKIEPFFSDFEFGLDNSGVNLGDFLGKHVGFFLDRISTYIEPIEPVIRLLKQNVPGVSDMSQAAGKGTVTFLELALAKYPDIAATAKQFVDALDTILVLGDSVSTLENDQSIFELMESVPLANDGAAANSEDFGQDLDVDAAVEDAGGQTGDPDTSSGSSRSILQQLEDIGVHLYFLDIKNDIRMLMGQSFDVIGIELPKFELPIEFQAKFPVWPVPPISVRLGLNAAFSADLSVGYDSQGIESGNFYNGFYFGDREDVFSGPDIHEFGLSVGVSLAALLDVLVASAGVEGEIRADILANWRDLDSDGKVRLDEIESVLNSDGLECLFDLTGQFRAIVRLVWEVLGSEGGHEFINELLFSFKNSCPTFELGHVSDGGEELPGGPESSSTSGTLILHAGAFADLRGPGKSTDTTEVFTVTELAPGVFKVEGLGLESRYANVNKIFFDGGNGNDSLTLVDVTVPVTALGGVGDDTLNGGTADDYLDGGTGDDILSGQSGADTIYGGDGDDTLNGAGGGDFLFGDAGNDTIDGGSVGDEIEGGSGDDIIHGQAGADTIDAGSGVDYVFGGGERDTIDGGPDSDLLLGDDGDDTINGGSGSDFISGGLGEDELLGDSGNDLIVGGLPDANSAQDGLARSMFDLPVGYFANLSPGTGSEGNDVIWGGLDNDLLIGDLGGDQILGGWGDDQLIAHLIAERSTVDIEHLEGGPNDDFICGADGGDSIFGGTSDLGLADVLRLNGGATSGGFEAVSCDTTPVLVRAAKGSLSGWKFDDQDGDANWDSTEPVMSGWTVELYDVDGQLVATQETDATGFYSFAGLEFGSYQIQEKEKPRSGYSQTFPASSQGHSVYLEAGADLENFNFGNHFTSASIRGQKFNDLNGDGVRDPGEVGINGWLVQLWDSSGIEVATSSTHDRDIDGDGAIDPETERGWFEFTGLVDGDYEVSESPRHGWVQTMPRLGQSADVNLPLLDDGFSVTESDAFVTGTSGTITDLNLTLSVEHKVLEQLDAWLIGPDGTRVELFSNVGGKRDHFTNTVFDDDAALNISDDSASAPFSGSYVPEGSLARFNGIRPDGSWTLVIQDESRGTQGQLIEWSLQIETAGGNVYNVSGGLPSVYTPENIVRYLVDLAKGESVEDLLFGNFQTASVESRKYLETSDNLPANLEPGLSGVTIYADLNNNNQLDRREPSTVTARDNPATIVNETGQYRLTNLPAGTYYIREVVPPRAEQVYPTDPMAAPGHQVTPRSGQTLRDRNFGNVLLGDIQGTKWLDRNGNGRRDPGEPGLPGVTIYVDLNDNGRFDSGDASTVTAFDDPSTRANEAGTYSLTGLTPGVYTLREVVPAEMVQTAGGRQVVYSNGFQLTPVGNEWSQSDVAQTPRGNRQYLGPFENESVTLTLGGLAAHESLTVSFDLLVIGSWDGLHSTLGPDRWQLNVRDGFNLVDTTFSNTPDDFPTFHNPIDQHDANNDGFIVPLDALLLINNLNQIGSRELRLAEWHRNVTFWDVNADGFLSAIDVLLIINRLNDEGAGTARRRPAGPLYPQSYTVSANSDLSIPPHPLGTPFVPSGTPSGSLPHSGAVEVNSLGYDRFNLPSGHALGQRMDAVYRFQFQFPHNSDSLTLDFSALGLRNVGELNFEKWGLDNVVVGIPIDHHLVSIRPGAIVDGVDFGNAPTGGVEGFKWDDRNGNRRRDEGEPGIPGVTIYWDVDRDGILDSNEPSTQTQSDVASTALDETGTYVLDGVAPGRQQIREVVPEGMQQTYPASGVHLVKVVAADAVRGQNFGNQTRNDLSWDFGDAPTVYHTLLVDNGARHRAPTPWFMGAAVDTEIDGQPTNPADGDDLNKNDDEDGVILTSSIVRGQVTTYTVQASRAGFLNAWVDWNNDGDWLDPNEQVAVGRPLVAGPNLLSFIVPNVPLSQRVYARFRFSNQQQLAFDGSAPNGEVEDYRFIVGREGDGEPGINTALGVKWDDQNGNGVRDANEPGLARVTIYADLNNNAEIDFGEPSVLTKADNPATPADELGSYELSQLPFGEVTIREVVRFSFRQTFPASGAHVVEFIDGENFSNLNFGNQLQSEVIGLKWRDLDADGEYDPNEPGMPGVTIYVDVNDNGKLDEGEPSTVTKSDDPQTPEDEAGQYVLSGIPYLTFKLREVIPAGWYPTYPVDGVHDITLDFFENVAIVDFGNALGGAIHGTKWNDTNGDGNRDPNEAGVPGVTIYVDANQNGRWDEREPSAVTMQDDPQTQPNETGKYWLQGLRPGQHRVREELPEGSTQTFPPSGFHTVQLGRGETVENIDFGNQTQTGSIEGRKWQDLDGDGQRDANEPGLAGVVIYLDANNNAQRDNGEPIKITSSDNVNTAQDETGYYAFTNLFAGTYHVREVVPSHNRLTHPASGVHEVQLSAGGTVSGVNFGNQPLGEIRGEKWEDLDGDGTRDSNEPGLAGVVVFVDLDDDGEFDAGEPFDVTASDNRLTPADETGDYAIEDLPQGGYQVREIVPNRYHQTFPSLSSHFVGLVAGQTITGIDFGNQLLGEVAGLKWKDLDGDGVRDSGEPGLAGVTVYADLDKDGRLDNGEPSTLTTNDIPGTPLNELGFYLLELPAGDYELREVVPQGYKQSFPNERHVVHVSSGNRVIGRNFGNLPIGDISGLKWDDLNADGDRDSNEPGLAGITIYLDANRNARFDPGELSTQTRADDPETAVNELGSYSFDNLMAVGQLELREVVPPGYFQTFPAAAVHVLNLQAGDNLRNINFGNHQSQGTVQGVKWNDATGALGQRNAGDTGLPGVTIFVDLDGNGRLDRNEPSAITISDDPGTSRIDEAGEFTIENVPPGTWAVLELIPEGSIQSFPMNTHVIDIEVAEHITGIDFGNYVPTLLEDGDDIVYAGGGADTVHGDNVVSDPRVQSTGTRRDTLYGEVGQDELFGQDRDDILWGGEDADELDGGLGVDWVYQTTDNDQILTNSELTGQGPDQLLDNSIEHAVLTGLSGDNQIDASGFSLGSVTLIGGGGSDTLTGTTHDDELFGGAGSDELRGGAGDDSLHGESGSDDLLGQNGDDTYWFGPSTETETDVVDESAAVNGGSDTLDFSALTSNEPVTVDLSMGTGSHGSRILQFSDPDLLENIFGGAGADRLTGSTADNLILGNAGNDSIFGADGNDSLNGGTGRDTLDGGEGDDLFEFDDAWGNNETVTDSSGADTLNLGSTTANLTVNIGSPSISDVEILDGTNLLTLIGNSIETLITGSGNDLFRFASDGVTLAGGVGTISAGGGVNSLDYAAYSATSPVVVDLSAGMATGTAGVTGIRNVKGGAGDDVLSGDAQGNTLEGLAGSDELNGKNGNDVLLGGRGNDILRGNHGDDLFQFRAADPNELDSVAEQSGEGFDTLDFSQYSARVIVDLNNSTLVQGNGTDRTVQSESVGLNKFFEQIIGTAHDDELIPHLGDVVLQGGLGNDVYVVPFGATGTLTLLEDEQEGNDEINFQQVAEDVLFDLNQTENVIATDVGAFATIRLESTARVASPSTFEDLRGGTGNDTLIGNDGPNLLRGGAGNDKLVGGRGNDVLAGAGGTNTLVGDAGNDTYRFQDQDNATENLVIEDAGTFAFGFVSGGGIDTLDFSRLTIPVTFDLNQALSIVGTLTIRLHDAAGRDGEDYFENVVGSATAANTLLGNSADNILIGGESTDTLEGRTGADILLGQGADDTLVGDQDRDLLIGGLGSDNISGGGEDDILIGGSTIYDVLANIVPSVEPSLLPALDAIRLAWISSVNRYEDRIDQIMNGLGNSNDPAELIRLVEDDTVIEDQIAESLDGQQGRDWFFADELDTVVPDPSGRQERVS